MDVLVVLFILFVILAIITIVGHVIWVIAREFLKLLFGTRYESEQPPSIGTPGPVNDRWKDLAATERQLGRFYSEGKLSDEVYELLIAKIRAEREPPAPRPAPAAATRIVTPEPVVTASFTASEDKIVIEPVSVSAP